MSIADKVFSILETSTLTGKELRDLIYGEENTEIRNWNKRTMDALRSHISDARWKYKVQIIADHNGRYHMCKNTYTFDSSKTIEEKIRGKIGRPRIYI